MVSPQLWVYDVKGLVPVLEAFLDERAKHPVLLVEVVEESTNMTVLAETAAGTLHGTAVRCHVSPPAATGRVSEPSECKRANHFLQRACLGNQRRRQRARARERCRQDTP